MELEKHAAMPVFYTGPGRQAQVLMLLQHMVYPMSHLPMLSSILRDPSLIVDRLV